MIVEQRTYAILPGKVPQYLDLYERLGAAAQKKHLGRSLGYYVTEIGELNQIIQLWIYDDYEDRATRRAALFNDVVWLEYFNKVIGLITHQENKILLPTSFISPVAAQWLGALGGDA